MATRNFVPQATGEGGLGTSAKRWRNVYADNGYIAGRDIRTDGGVIDQHETRLSAAEGDLTALKRAYAGPLTASTAAAMTDKSKVYVYTGSEDGYTKGDWYYHNGTAWISGGVYNAVAVETDKTLSASDSPADAKVIGDVLREKLTLTWSQTGHITQFGNLNANTDFCNIPNTDCTAYSALQIMATFTTDTTYRKNMSLAFYAPNGAVISLCLLSEFTQPVTTLRIPLGAKYFRMGKAPNDKVDIYGVFSSQNPLQALPTFTKLSGYNLVDEDASVTGYYAKKDDGTIEFRSRATIAEQASETTTAHNSVRTTDYIELTPGKPIIVSFTCDGESIGNGVWLTTFDSSKTAISFNVQHADVFSFTPASNEKYMRISYFSNNNGFPHVFYAEDYLENNILALSEGKGFSQNAINPENTTFIRKNVLDYENVTPGHYYGGPNGSTSVFENITDMMTEKSDWVCFNTPITLPKHGSVTFATDYPIIVAYTVKPNKILGNNYAMYPKNGVCTFGNDLQEELDIYVSASINNKTIGAYLGPTLDADENIIIDSKIHKSGEWLWYRLKNAPESHKAQYNDNFFVAYDSPVSADTTLKKFFVYSSTARQMTVASGMIDQRGWFVNTSTVTINVTEGYNEIDMTSYNLKVPAGYIVAWNVTSTDLYSTLAPYAVNVKSFTSLSATTVAKLTGKYPIGWCVYADTEAATTTTTTTTTSATTITSGSAIVSTPSGEHYRLGLSDSLDLVKMKVIPDKWVAIGNSLTKHPYKADVNWLCTDNRGMAASKLEYDYVHRMETYFKSKNSNYQGTVIYQGAGWETSSNRTSYLSNFDSIIDSTVGLITIQLSENAGNLTTFEDDMVALINYVRKLAPNAYVMLISNAWNSEERITYQRHAATRTKCGFVDLSTVSQYSNFQAGMGTTIEVGDGSTFTITNAAVAAHPGDEGMRLIAQTALRTLCEDDTITLS